MSKFLIKKIKEQKSKLKKERIKINLISLNIILISFIIFFGFLYLFAINQSASTGFEIKGLENQIDDFKYVNKKLQLYSAEMQSLSRIEKDTKEMDMVAVTHIEYLPAVGSVVAVK